MNETAEIIETTTVSPSPPPAPARSPLTAVELQTVRALYERNQSARAIGRLLHRDGATIVSALRRIGIEPKAKAPPTRVELKLFISPRLSDALTAAAKRRDKARRSSRA